MHVQFNIQTLGYVVAEFETKNGKIKIGHSSTYGDKFQELLNRIFDIYNLRRASELQLSPYSFEVVWYDDRVNYSWTIEMCQHDSTLQLIILELSPSNREYRRELVNEHIALNSLLADVFLSLEALWHRFGFIGYKMNWEVGNFPISEYLTLKADKCKWSLLPEKTNEDDEWIGKISMATETDLILFEHT